MSDAYNAKYIFFNRVLSATIGVLILFYVGWQTYLMRCALQTASSTASMLPGQAFAPSTVGMTQPSPPHKDTDAQTHALHSLIRKEEALFQRIQSQLDQQHHPLHTTKKRAKTTHHSAVLALPSGPFFALQLMGTRHPDIALRFIADHHMHHQTHCYASRLNGAPWYIVLYGHYTHIADAKKAQRALKAKDSTVSSWIKHIP